LSWNEEDRLDDFEERIKELEETLNGNHNRGIDGIIKELEVFEKKVDMLIAIMSPDALGHGGIKNRIRDLEDWRSSITKWTDVKWKFWTTLIVAVISTAGLVLTNLSNIADGFKKLAPNSPIYEKKKPIKKSSKSKRINLMNYKKCDPATDPYFSEAACSENADSTQTHKE
jgi:phage-related tail protein